MGSIDLRWPGSSRPQGESSGGCCRSRCSASQGPSLQISRKALFLRAWPWRSGSYDAVPALCLILDPGAVQLDQLVRHKPMNGPRAQLW